MRVIEMLKDIYQGLVALIYLGVFISILVLLGWKLLDKIGVL